MEILMNRFTPLLAVCVLALTAVRIAAADDKPAGFRADLLGQIEFAQKQILDLENAIPQDKMAWRPNKDVRSISEVYSHIAFGNYFLAKFAGIEPPAGITFSSESDGTKWEKATTDKKEIADQLVKSFTFVKDAIGKMSDADLEKHTTFFGHDMTARGMLLTMLSHMHEHLGQSIAYARMNNIVPPWTAAQQAEAKAKK
jgi:uncharacterized damage-inducible protein DinB